MKQVASHKTATPLMSILLILSMVLSVFLTTSMPLMSSKNSSVMQVENTMAGSSAMQHFVLSDNQIDKTIECPVSSENNVDHCTTCVFISNMVGISPLIPSPVRVSKRGSYPWHNGRLTGISKNVDLSPPKIG